MTRPKNCDLVYGPGLDPEDDRDNQPGFHLARRDDPDVFMQCAGIAVTYTHGEAEEAVQKHWPTYFAVPAEGWTTERIARRGLLDRRRAGERSTSATPNPDKHGT